MVLDETVEEELRELLGYAYLGVGVIGASSVVMAQESGTAILVTKDGAGRPYVWDEIDENDDRVRLVGYSMVVRGNLRIAMPALCVVIYPDGRIVRGRESHDYEELEADINRIYVEAVAQRYYDQVNGMFKSVMGGWR